MESVGASWETTGLANTTVSSPSSPIPDRTGDMVIKNQEVDYSMDKARIDAEGFDTIQALQQDICSCGHVISEDEEVVTILGIKFCERCLENEG